MKNPMINLLLLAFPALLQALDSKPGQGHPCQNPRVRKSWHTLGKTDRLEYMRAVKCLMNTPPKGRAYFPAITNRFEDIGAVHINQTTAYWDDPPNKNLAGPGIHGVGVFLPWHRHETWQFESLLFNECNYTGSGLPYWDWTLDNREYGRRFQDSPIFDAVYGVGGNGAKGSVPDVPAPELDFSIDQRGSCIGTGPFIGNISHLGPGYQMFFKNPRCIIRNFKPDLADQTLGWTKDIVPFLKVKGYPAFNLAVDVSVVGAPFGPHLAAHLAVAGEMSNLYSSVNDPLFNLHHCQMDRLWELWQSSKPENRWDMGGPIWVNGSGVTTLDNPLYFGSFVAPDARVRDVMDPLNRNGKGILCYTYDTEKRLPNGGNH